MFCHYHMFYVLDDAPSTGSTGVYWLTDITAININRERDFYEQTGILTFLKILFLWICSSRFYKNECKTFKVNHYCVQALGVFTFTWFKRTRIIFQILFSYDFVLSKKNILRFKRFLFSLTCFNLRHMLYGNSYFIICSPTE